MSRNVGESNAPRGSLSRRHVSFSVFVGTFPMVPVTVKRMSPGLRMNRADARLMPAGACPPRWDRRVDPTSKTHPPQQNFSIPAPEGV